jgi:hypothetical protein
MASMFCSSVENESIHYSCYECCDCDEYEQNLKNVDFSSHIR